MDTDEIARDKVRRGYKNRGKELRLARQPFNERGVPRIFTDHMVVWLVEHRNEASMTTRKLGPLLRQVGWDNTQKRFEHDGTRRQLTVWYPLKWPR